MQNPKLFTLFSGVLNMRGRVIKGTLASGRKYFCRLINILVGLGVVCGLGLFLFNKKCLQPNFVKLKTLRPAWNWEGTSPRDWTAVFGPCVSLRVCICVCVWGAPQWSHSATGMYHSQRDWGPIRPDLLPPEARIMAALTTPGPM